METADFVGKQGLTSITSFLSGVYADGGGDACEDVAGGLKVGAMHRSAAFKQHEETYAELYHVSVWLECQLVLSAALCYIGISVTT